MDRAIVPALYGAAARYGRYQTAAGLRAGARHVQYGRAAYTAARAIGSAWKRYRSYQRNSRPRRPRMKKSPSSPPSNVAPLPGNGYKSNIQTRFDPDPQTYRSLANRTYTDSPVQMPSTGLGVASRLTDRIFLKGIDLCAEFVNRSTNRDIEVHFALIQLKSNLTVPEIKDKFFRGEPSVNNTLPFVDDTANYDIRYKCNPLSPDDKGVLMHEKFILGSEGQDSKSVYQSGNKHMVHRYMKINRQVSLGDGPDDQTPDQPFKWVIWYMPMDGTQMSVDADLDFIVREKITYDNVV